MENTTPETQATEPTQAAPAAKPKRKLTATAVVVLCFEVVALVAGVCWLVYGPQDGAKPVTLWFGGIGAVVAVLSRVLGGAWFTDNANGH